MLGQDSLPEQDQWSREGQETKNHMCRWFLFVGRSLAIGMNKILWMGKAGGGLTHLNVDLCWLVRWDGRAVPLMRFLLLVLRDL